MTDPKNTLWKRDCQGCAHYYCGEGASMNRMEPVEVEDCLHPEYHYPDCPRELMTAEELVADLVESELGLGEVVHTASMVARELTYLSQRGRMSDAAVREQVTKIELAVLKKDLGEHLCEKCYRQFINNNPTCPNCGEPNPEYPKNEDWEF